MRSVLTVLLCTVLVFPAQQPQPALGVKTEAPKPQAPPGPPIKIIVVEGEGGINSIRSRTAKPIVVEVRDTSDKPVADAEVVFQLPSVGPSGSFNGWMRTQTTRTDTQGRAGTNGYAPNDQEGRYNIKVMAAAASQTATLVVGQSNARGSGKDAPEAKSSHKALWIALGVLGAGGVAIAVAATRGGNGTTTTVNPVTISAGPVTVGGPR